MIFNITALIVFSFLLLLSLISLIFNAKGFIQNEKSHFRSYLFTTCLLLLIVAYWADKVFI
jgi:hypothetical protein